MNISRFFASTNREAMRQVRLALGPDALIISNQRVNGGVEILAADPTVVARASEQAAGGAGASPQALPAALMQEFSDMRGAIESRMDALLWGNQLKQSANTAVLFQFLLGCGFSTALLRAMLKQLPAGLSMRAAQEWVRTELARNLPVLATEDALWKPGLALALVGPTGVGKTTTVAKLAARAVKQHGPEGVALLTTDTYRIGAYEQLKIYGELLRVPVRVVNGAEDLARVLALIPDWVTVLIDNMGVSQRDAYVAKQAAMLNAPGREVTRLLVLNASSHGETLDEVARRYAREAGSPLHGCIISKIDEASSFGAGLDAAIRYRLPIHFVSTGQKVPEDLLHLDAGQLVERALGAATDRPGLYAPSQDDLAALLSTSESESARQARRQRDGLDELLAILLTGSRTGSQATSPQVFQQACEAIEEILPVAEAWDTWRATAADKATSAVSRHLDRMFRSVRLAGHARPARPVLAVHGGAMLRQVQQGQGRRGTLNASLVLDAQGGALISAVQQIALPEGWWSSDGQSARQSPSPAAALARQVDTLRTSRPDWTIVHALGSHSRVLQDQLEADGAKWISEVGRLTRFYHQGTLSTAGAIARQLDHQPVDEGEVRIDGSGRRRGPWVLWAATAPVDVVVRQRAGRRLRFVSVQLVDRADGRVLTHWYATAGATLEGATTADLGRWVAAANTGRAVMRCAADLHGSMNTDASSGQDMMVALAATQMALAAHAILHEPGELEQALLALAERPDKLDLIAAAQTLGKLFALKKWLADTAA